MKYYVHPPIDSHWFLFPLPANAPGVRSFPGPGAGRWGVSGREGSVGRLPGLAAGQPRCRGEETLSNDRSPRATRTEICYIHTRSAYAEILTISCLENGFRELIL